MKKNFSINLYGELYDIDEDAYETLDKYLKSMNRYFKKRKGEEEVADDIEHRVAELLWERKEQGHKTVDIDAIRHIIQQIGNPEEIDGERDNSAESSLGENFMDAAKEAAQKAGPAVNGVYNKAKEHLRGRRFYRNATDKILGGVCGGLASYCGHSDPIWWRLGFVAVTCLSQGFFVILYLILWIVAPEASTPEDRLSMQGKDINPQTLGEQIINETHDYDAPFVPRPNHTGRGCLRMLVVGMLCILLFPLIILLTLSILWMVGMSALALGFSTILTSDPMVNSTINFLTTNGGPTWVIAICLLIVCIIPIYTIFRIIRDDGTMGMGLTFTLLLLWIAALTCGIVTGFLTVTNFASWNGWL